MQEPKAPPASLGIVYNTSMSRPDAALAIAALYVASGRRDARLNGICVNGSGLDAAIFCDIVMRFYTGTPRAPSSNTALPVGFDAGPTSGDGGARGEGAEATGVSNAAMVEAIVNKKRPDGQPLYVRSIQRVTDTAAPDALLRNAITFSVEAAVVLSAPATSLARAVALAGAADQYKQRVKRIVIVEAGDTARDPAALKGLVAEVPVPVVFCGREVGEALAVPRARIEAGFTWSKANPVADAVSAAGNAEVPLHDVAAMHYAVHPDSGYFTVIAGRLACVPEKKAECAAALVEWATANGPAEGARGKG